MLIMEYIHEMYPWTVLAVLVGLSIMWIAWVVYLVYYACPQDSKNTEHVYTGGAQSFSEIHDQLSPMKYEDKSFLITSSETLDEVPAVWYTRRK
jgi:hypothetical protein